MNRNQLVDAVARRLGDKRVAAASVEAVLDTVMRTVTAGEKVALSGFGVFEKADRAARSARNPATGATVELAATSVPRFRAGQVFKGVVSGQRALPPEPEPSQAGTSAADTGDPVRRRTRVAQEAPGTSRTQAKGGDEAAEGTADGTTGRGSEDAGAGGKRAGKAAETHGKAAGKDSKAGKPSAKAAAKDGKAGKDGQAAKKDGKAAKKDRKAAKDGQAAKKDGKAGKKDAGDGAKGRRSGRKG